MWANTLRRGDIKAIIWIDLKSLQKCTTTIVFKVTAKEEEEKCSVNKMGSYKIIGCVKCEGIAL